MNWILAPLSDADRELFCEQKFPTEYNHGFSMHKGLDTSLMNLADDIAYGVHDFEDGIVLKLLTREHWQTVVSKMDKKWAADNDLLEIEKQLFNSTQNSGHRRKQAVGILNNDDFV